MNDVYRKGNPASPGGFKNVRVLGADVAPWVLALPLQSPAGRLLAFGPGSLAAGVIHAALPPPKTAPGKIVLVRVKTAICIIELDVEVLPDGKDAALGNRAETRPDISGISLVFPGYGADASKKVVQLDSPLVLKGTIKVQTFFGPQANPSAPSGYGRGTTKEDEKAGNTTVGFHESNHRDDIITYLRTRPLPRFGGVVGLTVQEFQAAQKQYSADLQKYFDGIELYSRNSTDEVGYTRTEYEKKGPRKP